MSKNSLLQILRPAQRQAVEKIDEALQTRSRAVIALSAPTGIGKTLIALCTAALHEDMVREAIAVRTRSQLSSFMRDSIKFFNAPSSVAVAKSAACPHLRDRDADEDVPTPCRVCPLRRLPDRDLVTAIHDEMVSTQCFDIYELLPRLLHRFSDFCLYECLANLHRVTGLNWLIMTYPYIFYGYLARRREALIQSLPGGPKVLLVVDEAHNLEQYLVKPDAAVYETSIANAYRELDMLVRAEAVTAETAQIVHEAVRWVQDTLNRARADTAKLAEDVEVEIPFSIQELESRLGTDLETLMDVLDTAVQNIYAIKRERGEPLRSSLNAIRKFYAELLEAKYVDDVKLFYIRNEEGDKLEVRRVDPSKIYREVLSRYDYVLLLSGTMPSAEYLTRVWGIPEDMLVYIDLSHYTMGRVAKYVCTFLTSRWTMRAENYPYYAKCLELIFTAARKSVLAVTPSYGFAREVYSRLPESVRAVTVLETRRINLGDVAKKVQRGRHLIIAVAGGKLCEGVEFVGPDGRSLLSDIVIAGVPYPKKSQYVARLVERIAMRLGVSISDAEDLYMKEQAYIKVRQALGRGARSPEDEVNWWLLDERFTQPYFLTRLGLAESTHIIRSLSELRDLLWSSHRSSTAPGADRRP